MTPSARLALAIELLDEIFAVDKPADLVARTYLKARRFIGAKDRRAISERVWGILRKRARLGWQVELLGAPPTARMLLLADLILSDGLKPKELDPLFGAEPRSPAALTAEEHSLAGKLSHLELFHHGMPTWVKSEYPAWIEPMLERALGADMAAGMGAMRGEAPVDLRVNRLKATRDEAAAALAAAGLEAEPTPLSPLGLRLKARTALAAQEPFRQGLVEVQDEGSQLLALLTGVKPGQSAVDFCAGAGGKTLVMAAMMENKGRIVACDVNARRADNAALRLRRAGIHNVTSRLLSSESDKWVKHHAGEFDVVLIDAPCSGTGTWRRNPDAKWRLKPEDVSELTALQSRILESAARLVKPDGRLIYATCSLLREEGEDRAEAFLANRPDFRLIPVTDVWDNISPAACPCPGPYFRLFPHLHGTDGFFAAIMTRTA